MEVINWTTVDIFFAIIAASLPVLNSLVPQRWHVSSYSLPQVESWGRSSRRDRHIRHSMRLGSEEDFQPNAPFSRMSQLKFRNESILKQDSQETIHADESNFRIDGTEILTRLDFQRSASLEDDRDIEKYTYPHRSSDASFESKCESKIEFQRPLRTHQPSWSHDPTLTKADPV